MDHIETGHPTDGCACIRLIDEKLEGMQNPTRVAPALVRVGDRYAERACVVAHVPDEAHPRSGRTGRITRRLRPSTLLCRFCPFCGVEYADG